VLAFQQQRAQESSTSAQYELGMRYLKGDGVEKDTRQARHWLELAAKGGNTEARYKLDHLDAAAK
jgi:TPR repeat protein